MAKKKHTVKLTLVDLIRKKPKLNYLALSDFRVELEVEITTKSKIAPTQEDRLLEAAEAALKAYEYGISKKAEQLDREVAEMLQKGATVSEVIDKVKHSEHHLKSLMETSLIGASAAVLQRWEKEKNLKALRKESNVFLRLKLFKGALAIGRDVTRLVASSGGDVMAYVSILKEVKKIHKEVSRRLRPEATLHGALVSALVTYQKARADGIPPSALKTQIKTFNSGRTSYRDHTTGFRMSVDAMSTKAQKLQKVAKAVKDPNQHKLAIKLGAKAMQVKIVAGNMARTLNDRETFLDDIQVQAAADGLNIDDTTVLTKIKKFDVVTIVKQANELKSLGEAIEDLVEEIRKVA